MTDNGRRNRDIEQALDNEEIAEFLQNAENVGEESAEKIAYALRTEADNLNEAMERLANDDELREDLQEIGGVGERTVEDLTLFAQDAVRSVDDLSELFYDTVEAGSLAFKDIAEAHN